MLMWAGSGSAGWEAGIVNFLSPGDRVVVTICGAFGERWATLAKQFGLEVHRVEVEWGKGIPVEQFASVVNQSGPIKAALITHNETSTGVTNPLKELADITRRAGGLVMVDAVSSAGALPLEVDDWELDWVFSGVQKAWMCPPGVMMATVSERAMAASETASFNRFYLDVRPMAKAAAEGSTATTPAISLLYALDAALDAVLDESMEAVWARHTRLGKAFREGLAKLGVDVLAEQGVESGSVTAFHTPGGVSSADFQERIAEATGIMIATGQGPLAKTVNRVGHMGWTEQPEMDATLEAIEEAMRRA
jgi:aspartate aminotransferase-like enzyme